MGAVPETQPLIQWFPCHSAIPIFVRKVKPGFIKLLMLNVSYAVKVVVFCDV